MENFNLCSLQSLQFISFYIRNSKIVNDEDLELDFDNKAELVLKKVTVNSGATLKVTISNDVNTRTPMVVVEGCVFANPDLDLSKGVGSGNEAFQLDVTNLLLNEDEDDSDCQLRPKVSRDVTHCCAKLHMFFILLS